MSIFYPSIIFESYHNHITNSRWSMTIYTLEMMIFQFAMFNNQRVSYKSDELLFYQYITKISRWYPIIVVFPSYSHHIRIIFPSYHHCYLWLEEEITIITRKWFMRMIAIKARNDSSITITYPLTIDYYTISSFVITITVSQCMPIIYLLYTCYIPVLHLLYTSCKPIISPL